jgi:hypothetical protein
MGNSKSGVEFAINLDKDFYFSSEEARGHVFVNAKKRFAALRIILEIEGTETCEFRNLENQVVTGRNKLFNTSYVLAEFGHNQYLEGQLDFPFSFRFLGYLPGSFEENKQYKAKVSYSIKAIIVPKDKKS